MHTRLLPDRPRVSQPSAVDIDQLLTAGDIAEVLRVQRATALDYMRRGVIPACKIGRRWYAERSQLERHLSTLLDRGTRRPRALP